MLTGRSIALVLGVTLLAAGCRRHPARGSDLNSSRVPADSGALVVFNAASISRPVRTLLDTFKARTGVDYQQQPGATLEIARWIADLHRPADVILLADPDVIPRLLMPADASWYAVFARNRMVIAYTPRSRQASAITGDNWWRIVATSGVQVGRADPNTDPSGYRALLAMQLAETYYHAPGLARRLLDASPAANVRPREADQVALLQAGELDYIWTYQNLAENDGLRFVKLPDAVDLGDPDDSAIYATAVVRVLGKTPGDTLTVHGAPILFGLTVPIGAPHRDAAIRFVRFLLSDSATALFRAQHVDVLTPPRFVGSEIPAGIGARAGSRGGLPP